MYKIIDGKKIASEIKGEITTEISERIRTGKKRPHLAAILVGENPSSITYVNYKVKDCRDVGIDSTLIKLGTEIKEKALLERIADLNGNDDIDGFIVQLPLPSHVSETRIVEAIDPLKDADGFHPVNLGRMMIGIPGFMPATPFGIVELLRRYQIETSGKNCVIIGRSNIVGRPLSILLSQKGIDATVTVVHSRTRDIAGYLRDADILVAAIGSPGFVKGDMVKPGAVVIDVGTTYVASAETKTGRILKGDVDFDSVAHKCSYISPVPGGVGPMTRVALLKNTLLAARMKD